MNGRYDWAGVKELLDQLTPKEKREAIAELRELINREIFESEIPSDVLRCRFCESEKLIQYGATKKGTQRYQCKDCGHVQTLKPIGSILANTKLPVEKWYQFAECFVNADSCPEVADKLGVTLETAWYMRVRMMAAAFDNLPAFLVNAGSFIEVDETYLRESFKGISFDGKKLCQLDDPIRKSYKRGMKPGRGISDELICLMTGVNESSQFFYDVCSRSRPTIDIAHDVLCDRVCKGAIVNTDKNNIYPPVLRSFNVAEHNRFLAWTHTGLNRVNSLHSSVKGFLYKFRGVSTKWLHYYIGWMKWLRSFKKNRTYSDTTDTAIRQIIKGDSSFRMRQIRKLPIPFRSPSLMAIKTYSPDPHQQSLTQYSVEG